MVKREKYYKPVDAEQFLIERGSFDNWDSDMVDGGEQNKRSDDRCNPCSPY